MYIATTSIIFHNDMYYSQGTSVLKGEITESLNIEVKLSIPCIYASNVFIILFSYHFNTKILNDKAII